jgi:dipeptidyl aminopeptidase/acylaminoacyl peptidase
MRPEPRRLRELRWVIDNTIAAVGVDWSWPLSRVVLGATCAELHPQITMAINRMKKLADISREFGKIAERSEAIARMAESEGHFVTAREHYFSAANLYAAAQWPIWEDDHERNLQLGRKKNECYGKYIQFAAHPIEKVEIPFEGNSLPGYLHLPVERQGKLPCVLAIGGMDGWKEAGSPIYGHKFLERGIAVLAMEGPGQFESCIRKIRCTTDNFARAGKEMLDFLVKHPAIDAEKIALTGISMGSFWVPQILAYDSRPKAAAVGSVCQEPGMKTIFNEACPSFKTRFMWMAGYEDEAAFDKFAQTLSLRGVGAKIKCPVLIVAGEDDELSPIRYTYEFYNELKGPKKLLVYEGQKHSVPAPVTQTKFADWLKDRLDGKPMDSEIITVEMGGREVKR